MFTGFIRDMFSHRVSYYSFHSKLRKYVSHTDDTVTKYSITGSYLDHLSQSQDIKR